MATSFACLVYPDGEVSDAALSRGFAIALAGFGVSKPTLLVAPLPALPGWSVAFYRSGLKVSSYEELDHAIELFEEDLSPGLCVREAAHALAGEESRLSDVFAIVFSDEIIHDDAWRFAEGGITRRFVRDGDDGLEAGEATLEDSEVRSLDHAEDASDSELEAILRPLRGTAFVSEALGRPILAALTGALFMADRPLVVRLIGGDDESVRAETRHLNRVLGRVDGRASVKPAPCASVDPPSSVTAFASVYDFADPSDPTDLYREVAIGRITGTLHFVRPAEAASIAGTETFRRASEAGLYPLATLAPSALGGVKKDKGVVAVDRDGERLVLVAEGGGHAEAGPTFAELVQYLALGFKRRDDFEEDVIGALMLRAKLRAE